MGGDVCSFSSLKSAQLPRSLFILDKRCFLGSSQLIEIAMRADAHFNQSARNHFAGVVN
jgi:hypothetical protein